MKNKIVFIDDGAYVRVAYELVKFTPTNDHPEQEGCFLLKPVSDKPDFTKMTKQQLVEYIEGQDA